MDMFPITDVCSNNDTLLQFRMPIAANLSCASQSNSMEQRTVVVHHGCFSHNDARRVVDQDALPNFAPGWRSIPKTSEMLDCTKHAITVLPLLHNQ